MFMKRQRYLPELLICCFFSLFAGKEAYSQEIHNIILIVWDGAQKRHVQELLDSDSGNSSLPNLKNLRDEGEFTEIVIAPFIKELPSGDFEIITEPEQVSIEDTVYYEKAATDSGFARILTGKWNFQTGIFDPFQGSNLNIDYVCGNSLETVRDGITVMELLKNANPNFRIAAISSRHADNRDRPDELHVGIFRGLNGDRIYIPFELAEISPIDNHGFFSTTFANARYELDYYFGPEEMTEPLRDHVKDAHLPIYQSRELVFLREMKAKFVAEKAKRFVRSVYQQGQFFLFVAFCEPDLFGHIYGENSEEYSKAIISSDEALGSIVNELKSLGIYEESLIIVTTDHGATEGSNAASFFERFQGRKVLKQLGKLHGSLDTDNHVVWMVNNQFSPLPYTVYYQTDISPFILKVLNLP
jgi:hypothetical protein